MLGWIIQITLISVLIVFLVHHLIHFLKETLTIPKIKDLVNVPHERYKKMYETISSQSINNNNELLPINNQSIKEKEDMKNELKQFMKMQVLNNGF
jgi:hypothetical protein